MKRFLLVAFSVIVLCGMLLPTALVSAQYAGYENTNYQALEEPVLDGAWTTDTEWTDANTPPNLPDDFLWREKWTYPEGNYIFEYFLLEFFTDNTDDEGDYFQVCIDHLADGGDAPQVDDLKIECLGHDVSGLTLYQGDGSGWVEFTDYTLVTDIDTAFTLTSTPENEEAHWVIEVFTDRSSGSLFDVSGASYQPLIRFAVYDESTDTLAAWPPTSADVPSDWGQEYGTTDSIPESLTFMTAALLSSVAVVVSCYLLRSRLKTKKISTR